MDRGYYHLLRQANPKEHFLFSATHYEAMDGSMLTADSLFEEKRADETDALSTPPCELAKWETRHTAWAVPIPSLNS
jgi:hypothetical protein